MIISCDKCGTKFRLNDDAVKPEGSRVRCSLCRHIFTVHPAHAHSRLQSSETGTEKPPLKPPEKAADRLGRPEDELDDFEDFLSDMDENFLEDDFMDSRKHRRSKDERSGKKAPGREILSQDLLSVSSEKVEKRPSFLWRAVKFLFLLVFVAGIAAGGALYFLNRELQYVPISGLKPAAEISDTGATRLALTGVSGSFVDSVTAGSLFVIRGNVKNEYPHSRSFIQVKGSILDEKGKLVMARTAYAGNAMPDEQLDRMSAEDITKSMNNSYGIDNVNRNVNSGVSLPFMIVFESLPENVAEFTVETVRSLPGTAP